MERGRNDEVPSIKDAGWSIEAIGELAAHGIVFEEAIGKESLPDKAKALLPEGLIDALDDRPFMVFRQIENNPEDRSTE